ncbi:MAG: hypothetical protein RR620_13595 [Clostridium sp.]
MKRILSTMVVVMVAIISLVGCGSSNSPSASVKSYFEEVKLGENGDTKELILTTLEKEVNPNGQDEILEEDSFSEEAEKAMGDMLSKIEYKIGEEKIDGDKATVSVSLNNVNFSNLFMQFLNKYMTEILNIAFEGKEMPEEELTKLSNDLLIELMNSSEQETRTGDISLVKIDDKWQIDDNDSLTELMLGKLNVE